MQTLLDLHKRPTIIFDAKNPEHRKQFALFNKKGTWGLCPWTFYVPEPVSVKAFAERTVLEYYLEHEFRLSRVQRPRVSKKQGKLIKSIKRQKNESR
jgi:choline-glycine betaine transporter